MKPLNTKDIENLIKTVEKLRSDEGCPWDREQTHKTLKRYLIEETYEAVEAIEKDNKNEIMEELGDVLLQVVLHAQIASENNNFDINDVAKSINEKMISRHPHVFGDVKVKDSQEVLVNWELNKKKEKSERENIFDGIPISLPALLRGYKVSRKASKEGFKWDDETSLWNAFDAELHEFKSEIKGNNNAKKIEEFGDVLFMLVNIAAWYGIEPEEALTLAIGKFIKRFLKVCEKIKNEGKELKDFSSTDLNKFWDQAKKEN